MEHRPPPPVTIEGGPGWQLEGPPADATVDVDPDAVAARRAVLVLVGLLLAAALAALLADLTGAPSGGAAPLEMRVDRDRDGLRARPVPAAPVDRAEGVQVQVTGWDVDDGVATVALEAVNASAGPVAVEAVQPSPGLAVRLLTADGRPVPLPTALPPGALPLVAEVSVTDCAALSTDGRAWTGGTLVELRLAGDIGSAFFGSRYPLLAALQAAVCPDAAA